MCFEVIGSGTKSRPVQLNLGLYPSIGICNSTLVIHVSKFGASALAFTE